MPRSFVPVTLLAFLAAASSTSSAQSAAQHVAVGDSAYAARRASDALQHYLAAIAVDSANAAALWRASRTEVELAEFDFDANHGHALMNDAERHARAAVADEPQNAHAHFALAQALGRIALAAPTLERLPFATEIHKEALACLDIAPTDAGCLHVLALWSAEYMRLDQFTRDMANSMSRGKLFATATWAEAERNLLAAIKLEPNRAIHHLDLARIYRDEGKKKEAQAEFRAAVTARPQDFNDPHYQIEAKKALEAP
jgi:tetratricopeptide (TPR) repeat protein